MDTQEMKITKLCSFYVSDWHLTTMILPYINKKLNEGSKIATVLEKEIVKNVNTLIGKLNLKNKEKILNINWTKTENLNVNKLLEGKEEEKIIIINGNKKYIDDVTYKIEKYIKNKNINKKIKIISCYEVTAFNGSINEILDKNDKILNTSGEKEINEIFEGYKRKEDISNLKVI